MDLYSGYINKLIDELAALPGIGNKSAQRLAFHIIGMSSARVNRLSDTIRSAKEHVTFCKVCQNLTDEEICPICKNPSRDKSLIMVVENPRDLGAIRDFIMSCMARSLPCWASAPLISA